MLIGAFDLALMIAVLLCSLVAGLLFAFAVVVMPGIAKLTDKEYLLAFKHMDGIIQDNHPIFFLVWVGSIFSVIGALVLGTLDLDGAQRSFLWVGAMLYLLGVQLPTIRFNIPLNNMLQALDLSKADESEASSVRSAFEPPWNRWNQFRTLNAVVSVSVLLFLLFQQ